MKFLVPNYSCLQKTSLAGYRPQIPVLSVLCPQLNLLNPNPPPPEKNSWVRHCTKIRWLTRGRILVRLFTQRNEVELFVSEVP